MSKPRRKPATVAPVPNLHFVVIVCTVILIALCMTGYMFAPPGKERTYDVTLAGLIAFLVGKLSNNFGKALNFKAKVDAEEEPDEEEETTQ